MRFHILQHVAFESAAGIARHLQALGHELCIVRLYDGTTLPSPDEVQGLIVMGGPMSVHDSADHPWLHAEQALIRSVIDAGKPLLGVCLGAQLIACALGARVQANPDKEIGWFPVRATPLGQQWGLFAEQAVLHWHGETFSLPAGAQRLASSEACENQGFVWGNRVLALQFHLEMLAEEVALISRHCADELVPAPFVQSARQLADIPEQGYAKVEVSLRRVLDHWLLQSR